MVNNKNEGVVNKGIVKLQSVFAVFAIFAMAMFVMADISTAQYIKPEQNVISGLYISNATYYSPYPAEPGKYFDLYVRLQSVIAKGSLNNVSCWVEPSYPFSIDQSDQSRFDVGNLATYQEVLLKFKVRVDDKAVTGSNDLVLVCSADGKQQSTKLPIYIQAHDAVLQITNVESTPSIFEPNKVGEVTLTLDNLASVTLKDITVKLGIENENIPFAPVNETNEKRIQLIESGKETKITFNLIALSNAVAGTYKIPVTITYYDMLGKSYTKNAIIGLQIKTQPDLLVVHDQTTIVKNNAKSIVPISIVNRGQSKVTFVTAELLEPREGFTLLGPNVYYVGGINSDDSQTAEYEIFVNTTEKYIMIPLKIIYKDELENYYEQVENVKVNVFSKEDAIKYGYEKPVATDPLILGIGGIIVLYLLYKFVWKKFRKKKKTEFNE